MLGQSPQGGGIEFVAIVVAIVVSIVVAIVVAIVVFVVVAIVVFVVVHDVLVKVDATTTQVLGSAGRFDRAILSHDHDIVLLIGTTTKKTDTRVLTFGEHECSSASSALNHRTNNITQSQHHTITTTTTSKKKEAYGVLDKMDGMRHQNASFASQGLDNAFLHHSLSPVDVHSTQHIVL